MSLLANLGDVSLSQLAQLSAIPEDELETLLDYGVLTASNPDREPNRFDAECVSLLRRAQHLREDLALDAHGFALAVMLIGQMVDLETQLHALQGRLARAN